MIVSKESYDNENNVTNQKLKVLDLFSGIGGFSLGLERTGGFEIVAFCEIDEHARKVLKKHWPDTPIFEDISLLTKRHDMLEYGEGSVKIGELGTSNIDVICGGFPCQDISTANTTGKGLKGERSGLWREFKRLIEEIKPRYALIENVANLRSKGLNQVIKDLWSIGYDCEWHIIPACSVGALHKRERIWIIAYPHSESLRNIEQRKPSGWIQNGIQDQGETELRVNGTKRDATNSNCERMEGRIESRSNNKGLREERQSKPNNHSFSKEHKEGRISTYPNNFRLWRPFTSEEERRVWWAKATSSVSHVFGKIHEIEPTVCRVNDGISKRLDERARKERIKQLGNAVVPQIPELIGRVILEHENC